MSSHKGSIASLMHYVILELGSIPLASVVPSNDTSGTIAYSRRACVINGTTLLAC